MMFREIGYWRKPDQSWVSWTKRGRNAWRWLLTADWSEGGWLVLVACFFWIFHERERERERERLVLLVSTDHNESMKRVNDLDLPSVCSVRWETIMGFWFRFLCHWDWGPVGDLAISSLHVTFNLWIIDILTLGN